jgi:uncharacterized protein
MLVLVSGADVDRSVAHSYRRTGPLVKSILISRAGAAARLTSGHSRNGKMRRMSRRVWFMRILTIAAAAACDVHADAPQQLSWPDLLPKLPALDNPFAKLSRQQVLALSDIASVRERKARGESVSAIDLEDEAFAARRLAQEGIDVDGLLARRAQLAQQKQERLRALNTTLDGRTVRLPGYLLPLEFSGKLVSEFLLVPWVGACIHTPPPPPNQIVHVKAGTPVEYAGLFKPVWVTGRLSAASSRKSVHILDGAAEVDVGYALQATDVQAYSE